MSLPNGARTNMDKITLHCEGHLSWTATFKGETARGDTKAEALGSLILSMRQRPEFMLAINGALVGLETISGPRR